MELGNSSEEPSLPEEVFEELQGIFEGPANAVDEGVEDLCRKLKEHEGSLKVIKPGMDGRQVLNRFLRDARGACGPSRRSNDGAE